MNLEKNFIPTQIELVELYKLVGWEFYMEKVKNIQQCYEKALCVYTIRDDKKLIAAIRVVGDGISIIYIQDLLVHPDYQRQGLATKLLKLVQQDYEDCYQKVLISENDEMHRNFYKKLGFHFLDEASCMGYIQLNQDIEH
ncbi:MULTISPECIES: GNAT family N-acetyltransferase [unclassified Breznakia]|uniref:GNAT family N-acetyltransferase n=1 Tax=unclassified Breznakia TaxID=2623764 RepID=UPI0024756E33|nr:MULTISPECIES: GNAT family N-acetyltransferase [unclassified Breznakia]MDH6366012.1 ribosomal protein S18 acetylase RimI-like enzyme [Breznakia sp. PH1-1]MDH6403056.1 ribosomal protein S18 acetylase RimI-like enzyme [Breznakia sp. PF1-11]MDH6410765.1 ribosomal protein S18 acetylase RimI-like enzyme [Breznakia sp. PFB1-11]MDH6413178.1 ribosomal protein S18 acetylase RimI-like enzyme [Breznakia sp. PFB1-14]MDH6415546.1 ribosomal protein S18 acetylase RimI-like enzyme [Breznakia sp. PFB1-4]